MINMLFRPRRVAFFSAVISSAVVIAGCSGSHAPAGPASTGGKGATGIGAGSSLSAVCQAAKKEGQLNYETSTDPDQIGAEVKAFEARYPGIKVNVAAGQEPQDNVAQIIAKVQAHHALGVDGLTLDIENLGALAQQRLIAPVDWKALGVSGDKVLNIGGEDLVRTQRIILGLGYNSDKISADQLPNTWNDLLDPKWSGKFVVDPRGKYLAPLGITWGYAKALAWYKKLLKNNPQLVEGASDSVSKVASGEALFSASSHDSEINEAAHDGAHVKIKYLDVAPAHDNYGVVLAGAAHPNAAACFLGWFDSPEGQAMQLKTEFKGNETTPAGLPAGSTIASAKNSADAAVEARTSDAFAKLSTG
jgi:iron(III) transport system substrate-binding protein